MSPHCLQLLKGYIQTQSLPSAQLLLSIIASALAAGTGSLGDRAHCWRGLRTLVSNSKHIIMQDCRIIELEETWKGSGWHGWQQNRSYLCHLRQTFTSSINKPESCNLWLNPITSYPMPTKKSSSLPLSSSHLHACKMLLNILSNLFFTKKTWLHGIFPLNLLLIFFILTALASNCPADPYLSTAAPKIWTISQLRLY